MVSRPTSSKPSYTLREKCSYLEFCLVFIFSHWDWIGEILFERLALLKKSFGMLLERYWALICVNVHDLSFRTGLFMAQSMAAARSIFLIGSCYRCWIRNWHFLVQITMAKLNFYFKLRNRIPNQKAMRW